MNGRLEAVGMEFVRGAWADTWGFPVISLRGSYMPEDVEGLVWRDEQGEIRGLITWSMKGDSAEIVTLDAYEQGRHIGGRLLDGAEAELCKRAVRRIWITTTNDNLRAQALYVRHGYRLVRVELDGMARVRAAKPQVPDTGMEGIPLRDMLELEKKIG